MDGDVLPTSPSRAPTAQSPPVTHTLDSRPNTQVPHNPRGLTRTASTRSRVASSNMDARAVDNCCPTLPKRIIEQPARALEVFGAGNGGDWPALQPAAVAVSPWPRSPPPLTNVHPSQPPRRRGPPVLWGPIPSLTNRTQQRKKRMAAPRCVCVCMCVFLLLPSVFPVGNYLPTHGELRRGLVVAPEDTCTQETDRRCALPLGCGFCGIPKRVEPVR